MSRHLNTLAGMVTGIVLGKSSQLPTAAAKAPDGTLAESRNKRFSRCTQNEAVRAKAYFLPFIELLLTGLAQARPPVFLMDGSEVGRGYCSARDVTRVGIIELEKRYACY